MVLRLTGDALEQHQESPSECNPLAMQEGVPPKATGGADGSLPRNASGAASSEKRLSDALELSKFVTQQVVDQLNQMRSKHKIN